jgi:uncharacterized Zn finger protein
MIRESDINLPESRSSTVLSNCPQCDADLVVLRVIGGKAGSEYWTMRCTRCGGIHLDIVKAAPSAHPA